MTRRKFIGQVTYQLGGAPEDLFELTIVFNRKEDRSTSTWLQIGDAIERFSEDSDSRVFPRLKLANLADEMHRQQAEREVVGKQIQEILMALILVLPDFVGHVISDALSLLADEDTEFSKPLTVKDREHLKRLYREAYKLYREHRRRSGGF